MIRQKNIQIVLAITLLLSLAVDVVEAGSKKRRGTATMLEHITVTYHCTKYCQLITSIRICIDVYDKPH